MLTTAGYLISADTVRQQVPGRRSARLPDSIRSCAAKPAFRCFRAAASNFADVALGDAEAACPYRRAFDGTFAVFPLLIGRVEIADVSLDHPRIMIEFQPNGQSNWSGLIEALTRSQAATHRLAAFSEMRIDGGTVDDPRRSTAAQRDTVRCGILAGLAVDLKDASAPPVDSSGTMRQWTRA